MATEKLAQVIDFAEARKEWNCAVEHLTAELLDRATQEGILDLQRLCRAALSKTPGEGRRIARRACVQLIRDDMVARHG